MVSSTGTFVSCKDYDDDIDQINQKLDGVEATVADLQKKIGDGAFVKSITPTADGFTVTMSDGSSTTITGIKGDKGEAGKDGAEWTIIDGYWACNGEKTTVKAEAVDGKDGQKEVEKKELTLDDPALEDTIGYYHKQDLFDEIELLDGAGDEFDLEAVRNGQLTPVFFGSALTNFGVEPFLEQFLQLTTPPLPRETVDEKVEPMSDFFSAFVFKIQANMNKAHRDRVAFMRICSGKFEKNMEVFHVQGNKKMRLSQPQQIMAQEREIVDEAYAGDIIGVFDPGIFSIGDTICSPGHKVQFRGIPTFAPEHFALVRQKDTMKRKQFIKGISQIAQEGAIQIFQELDAGMEEVIVGVVGVLQFDVLKYRLQNEYNCDIIMETLPYEFIRWIVNDDIDPKTLDLASDTKKIQDLKGNHLLLFTSYWSINWALEHNKGLELAEFGTN